MKKDRNFIHWKLWRFTVDCFTDWGDWFIYFRYWKPNNKFTYKSKYEVYEIRFSSAGFMCSSYFY